MHIDLNGVGGFIALILAGLIILFGAVATLRATYAKTSIEALRGDRDDLMTRVEILENENKELKQKAEDRDKADAEAKLDFETRLTAEVAKRELLEGVVTGREALAKITSLLEQVTLVNVRSGKVIDAIAKEMGLNVA